MPGLEQLVRLPEQLSPDLGALPIAIDHRLEIAAEVSPADLSRPEYDPPVPGKAITDDDRIGLLAEKVSGHRTGPGTDDAEDNPQAGHHHPEPRLAPVLPPARLVDVGRVGRLHLLGQLGHRLLEHLGRDPLQLGDHAHGDGQAQQVGAQLSDLPLAQPVCPREDAEGRVQPGAKGRTRHPVRQPPAS